MSFVLQLKFSLNHIIRNHVAMIIALGGGGGGWGGWELNAIVQNKSNLPHKQLNEFVPVAFLNDSG